MDRQKEKISIRQDDSGIAHLMIIGVLVALVLVVSGYFIYTHRSKPVSLQGTLSKSACSENSSGCATSYMLQGSNSKTYSLDTSGAPVAAKPGDQVVVKGTAKSSGSSTVNVQSITLVNPTSQNSAASNPSTSPIYPHDITTSSNIASDDCSTLDHSGPAIGDVGCSITLKDGWTVQVLHGNTFTHSTPGSLNNAPAFNKTWIGYAVTVYAQATAANQATILTASKYYVNF